MLVVIYRYVSNGKMPRMRLRWFAPLGAFTSFLSALVGTVGPLTAPFFLAYGLVKGAYIGTEALAAVTMHVTKLVAYQGMAALSLRAALVGVLLGPLLVLGSFLGKRVVDRVSEKRFTRLVEAVLTVAGLVFLIGG